MKKKIFAILLAGTLVLSSSPPVFADEKDDKIEQLEAQISEMQKTIDELQKQLDEASSGAKSTSQDTYKIGESYVVEGQWKITVDSVETTDDRNEYSDKNPAAVYLVTYTYENPRQLSGGQQQRVAFARALAPNPQLLLLDEPFAAIDAKVRQELRSWLKEMISKLGVTSIFVTHDQDEAIEVADEIIITNRGHIEQMGTPIEIYRHPQTAFTASFFGQTSVLADYQKYHTFQRMDGVEKAIVRPEFLKITRKNEVQKYGSSASKGVVERTSFRGDWIELAVRVHGDLLIAKRDLEEEPITVGETVDVFLYRLFVIAGEKCYLLENQSLQDDSVFI